MPRVSVVVELNVEVDSEQDPLEIEQAIDAEGKRASRELYVKTLETIDEEATQTADGARQRLEPRYIATLFGRVRIHRWRVRKRGERGFHPLDRRLGLRQSEPSPALREVLCDLACRTHYRQVADICKRITGEAINHLLCWRVVQDEGGQLIDEEGKAVQMIFGEHPQPLPQWRSPPDVVMVEADGTYLRAQGKDMTKEQRSFEIKTGIIYTGKERAGGRKHQRWRLVGKHAHATADNSDDFGKGLATKGFHRAGLHQAQHVVCLHDGLDEFGGTFHDWFPNAIHQTDRYHVNMRIWQIAGGDKDSYAELKSTVFNDPIAFAGRLRGGEFELEHDKAEEIASYILQVGPHLSGIDKLPRHMRRGKMRVTSTSVVEKHQDLLVGRRMKRRGMRWSKKGANNLLALQTRKFCNSWPTQWGVVPE